jgi:ankyrin repeat protein
MLNLRRQLSAACLLLTASLWCGLAPAATPGEVRDFFLAISLDDPKTVTALLVKTINPNSIDPIGGEPGLVLALREGSMRSFQALLAHPDCDLELTALNGNTALMMAAFTRNPAALQALLAKGARVNRPGWTALHYAAASGDAESARILLAHQAAIDAEAPYRLTPLMIAAREGQEAVVDLLLAHGADARRSNSESLTAAQIAVRADKPRIEAAIATHLAARK